MRTALIDGDVIKYHMGFAAERSFDFGDTGVCLSVDEDHAKRTTDGFISEVVRKTKADRVLVCLSCTENWRYDVLPTYKHNRVDARKPELLPFIVEYLKENYETFLMPRLEADDVMGILSTTPETKNVIVSIDKDMQTIPGLLFNPDKDKRVRRIAQFDADKFHMYQTLMGDTVDGYKGCPGVGPKTAEKLLAPCRNLEEMWAVVVKTYVSKGLTEADALVQARVARICRHEDYDHENERVKLWQPPS